MSGPDYPPPPAFGSNATGSFAIGISPMGDIPYFDVWRTIISQYANSPILVALLEDMFQYIDPTKNLNDFFDTMWNVDTAIGRGLDNWGRIVGVSRIVQIGTGGTFFGFQEAVSWEGWNQAPWYSGQPLTENGQLTDTAFRVLIMAKALANICDCSIPAINQVLLNLFPNRGNCYVIDNQDMTMVYKFEFVLSAVEQSIVNLSGILPKPVGVSASVESL